MCMFVNVVYRPKLFKLDETFIGIASRPIQLQHTVALNNYSLWLVTIVNRKWTRQASSLSSFDRGGEKKGKRND